VTNRPGQETAVVAVPHPRRPDDKPLTGRELEILGLVVEGLSSHRVGRVLGISEKTVKNHLTAVYAKLAVTCRAEAIACAIRRGLVRL
jgi:DNA-binding NarL/FixJ family response regulator